MVCINSSSVVSRIHRDHIALDQFRHLGADHVRAEQLAGLLVEDHLDETLVLAERDRLAVADEREAADADFAATFLGFRLGQSDGGDLRMAIGAAGNEVLVGGVRMQALDGLDTDHALMLGLVRQHRRAGDIADGVDAGDIGLAKTADHDAATVGLDAELLQPEIFDIADHADRGNHPVDLDGLRLALAVIEGRDHAVALLLEFRHLGVEKNLDALLFECLMRQFRNLGIFHRQHPRQHLDHRHLRPHGAEERGKLDADRAGADHQQRFRHLLRHHRLKVGPDQFLVGLQPRQHARPGASRDDDMFCLIGALAERALRRLDGGFFYRNLAGRVDRGVAPDDRNLVLLHQEPDAVVETF